MVRNSLKVLGLISILSLGVLAGCSKGDTSKEKIEIGISQIAEHPALDSAREGFIKELESQGFKDGENLKIDFQNAQGDMASAQTIAQNFSSKKKDMILAIGTPTAQAAYNSTKEIPILITAITDPVSAGLVKSMDKTETNVAGTSDMAPIEKQMELLKKVFPEAKRIGVLFNTSEVNSEVQLKILKDTAKKMNLEIVESGITSVNDIPQALDSIINKVDVIYTPTDNVVASAINLIASKAAEKNIAVIGSEEAHVEGGALISEGINYNKLGAQTAKVAIEIINGKNPKELSVSTAADTEVVINEKMAEKLGIKIPEEVKAKGKVIKGGK